MIRENPKTTIFIAYVTYALGQFCFIAFNILIFRQFSLEEVGAYGLIISIVAFAGFALDLGITQTLVRGFSQQTLSLSQAMTAAIALRLPVLGLGLAGFVVWRYFNPSLGVDDAGPLVLAILAQFLIGFRVIATSWLRAHDRQNISNTLNLLHPVGYFAVGVSLLSLHKFHLLPLFLGILLVEMIITAFSYLTVKKIRMPDSIDKRLALIQLRPALAAIWKPSLIFFVVSFWAVVQSRLDWIMVYAYGSKTNLAYYSLANKVYELFESGVSVLINTTFPWMCKMLVSGEKNPRLIIGFKGIAFLSTILAVATALWLPGLLTLLWGDKFEQAHGLIFLLMLGACLNTFCSLMYYLLIAAGKEKYFLITSTVPALCQVGANVMFIPKYGNYGAIIGMMILISTSFLLLSIFCHKDRLTEYLGLFKNSIIFVIVAFTMVSFEQYLKQSHINSALFIIASLVLGTLTLFSKQERSLVLEDVRGTLGWLSPKIGKDI